MKYSLIAIAMLLLMPGLVQSYELPEVKKNCETCHVLNAQGTRVRLKLPISELCLECHPERMRPLEHAVDIKPMMRVSSLPLFRGKITCITCHEPHGLTNNIKLLRGSPTEICKFCHKM